MQSYDLQLVGDSGASATLSFGGDMPRHGTFITCAEIGFSCFCSSGCDRVPGAREFAGVTRTRRDGLWLGFAASENRRVAMIQDDRCMGDGNFYTNHQAVQDDYFRVAAYTTLLMADRLWHPREVTMLHPGGECGWPELLTMQWLQGIGECLDDHRLSLRRIRVIGGDFDSFRTAVERLDADEQRRAAPRPKIAFDTAQPAEAGLQTLPGELVLVKASAAGWPG